ncbi:MAG: ATP-binding cassette domain-containing protein [Chromatiaceae bacterium]|nr:ATP-binding cassette domain-containing protein [Chromatiaceae bacterium]
MSREQAAPPRILLRLQDLVAGYTVPVVGPVSCRIQAGEVVGLWGANGSGKSTLLNAIADAARIFSGRIERAPGLTLNYQEQRPVRLPAMPLTGRDLLRCAGVATERRPPGSLGVHLGRRLDRLSGGQYQLLCVWAALAGTADLVLLDEPTNNLDPEHERLLAAVLSEPRADRDERRAVLLVSHERAFLEDTCTRVLEVASDHPAGRARSPRRRCA